MTPAAALHEAHERAVYAALADDAKALDEALADVAAAHDELAQARRGRVQAIVRSHLDALEGSQR
jgi:hypothetical protein